MPLRRRTPPLFWLILCPLLSFLLAYGAGPAPVVFYYASTPVSQSGQGSPIQEHEEKPACAEAPRHRIVRLLRRVAIRPALLLAESLAARGLAASFAYPEPSAAPRLLDLAAARPLRAPPFL